MNGNGARVKHRSPQSRGEGSLEHGHGMVSLSGSVATPSSQRLQRRQRGNNQDADAPPMFYIIALLSFFLFLRSTSSPNVDEIVDVVAARVTSKVVDEVMARLNNQQTKAKVQLSPTSPNTSPEIGMPISITMTPAERQSKFGGFFSRSVETKAQSGGSYKDYGPHAVLSLPNYQEMLDNRRQCLDAIRSRHKRALADIMGSMTIPKVLLVDPAYHRNVGDSMLTRGEHAFFESYGWSIEKDSVYECDMIQGNGLTKSCNDVLPRLPEDVKVAFWHAGGNWGDLWDVVQESRINSMETLLAKGFAVIGMPQSFHYNNEEREVSDVKKLKDSIARGLGVDMATSKGMALAKQRVFLAWREHESYEKAVRRYPFVQNRLMPDIALQLGPYTPIRSSPDLMKDILLLLREDHESKKKEIRNEAAIRKVLDKIPGGKKLTFSVADWWDRIKRFGIAETVANNLFTSSSVQLLSLGKILIADRLHATILAYISGIPVIYVDQKTKKISRTFGLALQSWEGCKDSEKGLVFQADSVEEALSVAVKFLKRYEKK